jgi:hypothetical protein
MATTLRSVEVELERRHHLDELLASAAISASSGSNR